MAKLQNLLVLIRPGVYMAFIDREDVFYSVPAHRNHQDYLTFFVAEYLKLVCVLNGYGPNMRLFTKI